MFLFLSVFTVCPSKIPDLTLPDPVDSKAPNPDPVTRIPSMGPSAALCAAIEALQNNNEFENDIDNRDARNNSWQQNEKNQR